MRPPLRCFSVAHRLLLQPAAGPHARFLAAGLTASALALGLRGETDQSQLPFRVGVPQRGRLGEGEATPVELPVSSARSRGELFFIDADVADPRAFWLAAPKSATVICIPPDADSWAFMAREAEQFRGLGAIHIVSAGEPGALVLNGRRYTASDLKSYAAPLDQLGRALTKNGDIFLYCGDAEAGGGRALLNTLARATGVDAAFSKDLLLGRKSDDREMAINTGHAVLFVDARVQDSARLLQDLAAGTEVVYLQPKHDGLQQMSDYLARHRDAASVQIVAHGSAGDLWLGSTYLSGYNIAAHAEQLAAIGREIRAGGDILIYACDTAAGAQGLAFVHSLADLTGRHIAASSNRTGEGGDWNLEIKVGEIEAASVLSASSEAAYDHHLSLLTVTSATDSGAGSLRNAIAAATAGDTIAFNANMTITLSSALIINKNLTIEGDRDSNGTPDVTIDANYHSRVLSITSGTVLLDGLIIEHGLLSGNGGASGSAGMSQLGAGISNAGVLTLNNVTLTQNLATGGGGGGGVTGGDVGGGGGGGSGALSIGGGNGGLAGTYAGLAGGYGIGGNGGSFDSTTGNPPVVNPSGDLNGKGGTSSGGGAGGNNYFSYGTSGAGATASGGGFTIGGGGGGSGWNTTGNPGGNAAGGIYNSGTLTILGATAITNNLGAGGGGGSGGGAGNHGGLGGQGVGGIWNSSGGTVRIAAGAYAAMTGNVGASGAIGGLSAYGGSNAGFSSPAAASKINTGSGTIVTNYVPDDAPVATTSGGTTAFTEGNNVTSTPVTVDSGFTVTDDDNSTLASATVAITSGLQSGEDALSFTNTNGTTYGNISASYNSGTGRLTLTSSGATATTAQWQAALRAVTYTNSSDTPNTGNRTVSFTVNDGLVDSATVTKTVSVSAVDDSPVGTTSGGTTAFTEGNNVTSTPVVVDSGFTVTDADNTTLSSASVAITGNFHTSEDGLSFTNTSATTYGNIGASYNSTTGVLILTSSGATATKAQWQAALRAVTYTNSSNTPNTSNRTISFTVNDGTVDSSVVTKTVSVASTDDTPIVTSAGGTTAFIAGDNVSSTPVAIDTGIAISDADNSTLASASVAITGNFHNSEDVLAFINTSSTIFGNISASYNSGTGVLTLTSSGALATTAQWQAALSSVTYSDTAVTPNVSNRTISFTANDGTSDSASLTRGVTVADTDQTPIVVTTGGTTPYVGGATAVVVDSGITISDFDNETEASGTVAIGSGFNPGDVLAFTNTSATLYGNISASYNASTGVLTLTSSGATATQEQWANAFDTVTFSAGTGVSSGNRSISFVINDGAKNSAAASKTIGVVAPPIVTTDSGSAAFARTTNVSVTPVVIDSGMTITDASSSILTSATVAITGNFHSSEDGLAFINNGSTMGDISASYNATTGVMTLSSAAATLAQWTAALRSVNYSNAAITPNPAARTISFTITDSNSNVSNTATRQVTVTDAAPPSIASVSVPTNGTYSAGQNLDFVVTFDEIVTVNTGGGTPYLTITLGTGGAVHASYLSGSGTNTLTFRYSIVSGNGDTDGVAVGASVALNGGTIEDASANFSTLTLNSVGSTASVLVDAIPPVIASNNRQMPSGASTNANSIVYRVTFSKNVTGVDSSDFTLTATGSASGTITSAAAVSGSVYDVTVSSVAGDGTLRLDLKSSGTGITDTVANAIVGGFTSGQTYSVDHTAPVVASSVRQTPATLNTALSNVTYRVTFNEAVTGVDVSAFSLTTVSGTATGTIASVNAISGTVYDVTVSSLTGLGVLRLDVNASGTAVVDSAGNALSSGLATGNFYVIGAFDVFNFTALSQTSTRTVSAQLGFKVAQRFTTPATGPLTVFDVAAQIGSSSSAQPVVTINRDLSGVIGSVVGTLTNPTTLTANSLDVWTGNFALAPSTTYWVVFTDTSASGIYAVGYTTATSGGGGTWPTVNDYQFQIFGSGAWSPSSGGLRLEIGALSPVSISSLTPPADGSYHDGQNLDFVVNFSNAVTVTGTPTLGLTIGSTSRLASYVSGSGTSALLFRYTVQVADADADGIVLDSSLTLNGGMIQDVNTTDAALTFTPPSTAGIVIGTPVPAVTSATSAPGTYGSSFNYTITASSVVSITSYSAVGLPTGLSFDSSTGVITGIPTQAGSFNISLGATNAAGTGTATLSLSVAQASATLTLGGLTPTYTGGPLPVVATTSPASLAVAVTYNTNSAAPTAAGSYAVVGTITDPNYTGSASATLVIAKADQTVTFDPASSLTVSVPVTLSANASSDLPVSFSLISGPASLTGSTLTPTGNGDIVVRATQTGNANYNSVSVDRTLNSGKLAQTITFASLANHTAGDAPFILSATASSGLPVTFTVDQGPASINGSTLTLTSAPGLVSIRASQAGDATRAAASDVIQTFTVTPIGIQVYFGETTLHDTVAGTLAQDNTRGTLIGYLASVNQGFVVNFAVNNDGTFQGLASVFSSPTLTPQSATTRKPKDRATTLTFNGSITNGVISGTIAEYNLLFTANVQPQTGSTAALAGYYAAPAVDTVTGSTYVVVGTGGRVYALAVVDDVVSFGSSTVNTAGTFTIAASAASAIAGQIDPATTKIASVVTVGDVTIDFAGLNSTSTRTDRLINLSSRGDVTAAQPLIAGFVIGGTVPKRVLLRGVGPGLVPLGVTNVLSDPKLRLFNQQGQVLMENDNWTNSDVAAAITQVGAFDLAAQSKDAAILITLDPGVYTMHIVSNDGTPGVALAEVYDATETAPTGSERLINISSRATVGSGEKLLIGGFVVTGNSPKRLLIRGAGPSLASYGVSPVLVDPVIKLFDVTGTVIARNDDWSTPTAVDASQTAALSADIIAAEAASGAFPFPTNSKDAALIITLNPGLYTVELNDATNTGGSGLIEVYEVQ